MSYLLKPRLVFVAIFLGCAGLLLFGLYLQHALDLEPCPMCILQRYAFLAIGLIAGVAALQAPARAGTGIYAVIIALAATAGGGVAAWQTWLQHNPPQLADCGPGLEFMVESFPLTEALPMIFRGSGDCSKVQWSWLGLSIAEWSLVAFSGIFLVAAWTLARSLRARRDRAGLA